MLVGSSSPRTFSSIASSSGIGMCSASSAQSPDFAPHKDRVAERRSAYAESSVTAGIGDLDHG